MRKRVIYKAKKGGIDSWILFSSSAHVDNNSSLHFTKSTTQNITPTSGYYNNYSNVTAQDILDISFLSPPISSEETPCFPCLTSIVCRIREMRTRGLKTELAATAALVSNQKVNVLAGMLAADAGVLFKGVNGGLFSELHWEEII